MVISALRAYVSMLDGKIVAPSATRENTPARQTAVIRKKCIPNHAAWIRFACICPSSRDGPVGWRFFRCACQTRMLLNREFQRSAHRRQRRKERFNLRNVFIILV